MSLPDQLPLPSSTVSNQHSLQLFPTVSTSTNHSEYVPSYDVNTTNSKIEPNELEQFSSLRNSFGIVEGKASKSCLKECSYKRKKSKFMNSSYEVKKYWQKVMPLYASVNDELRFPIFPEKTEGLNHISALLWMATFAMEDISADLAEAVDIKALNDLYAHTIEEGNLTEMVLEEFYSHLNYLSEKGDKFIDEMKISVEFFDDVIKSSNPYDTKITSNNIGRASISDVKKTLLIGSRIHIDKSFPRLKIYTRTAAKRKWYFFNALPRPQRLSIIKDSLVIVADSFIKLRKLLHPVLLVLRDGESSIFNKTFLKHLEKMSTSLNKLSKHDTFLSKDDTEILNEVRRAELYLENIIGQGQKILNQTLEVIGMTRVCYKYLIDKLELPFTTWEEISEKFINDSKFNITEFDKEDFLHTRYPDILRKVPVVINRIELSLHKMDFKRKGSVRRSSVSAATGYKA